MAGRAPGRSERTSQAPAASEVDGQAEAEGWWGRFEVELAADLYKCPPAAESPTGEPRAARDPRRQRSRGDGLRAALQRCCCPRPGGRRPASRRTGARRPCACRLRRSSAGARSSARLRPRRPRRPAALHRPGAACLAAHPDRWLLSPGMGGGFSAALHSLYLSRATPSAPSWPRCSGICAAPVRWVARSCGEPCREAVLTCVPPRSPPAASASWLISTSCGHAFRRRRRRRGRILGGDRTGVLGRLSRLPSPL